MARKRFLSKDEDYIELGLKPPERTIFEGSNEPIRPDNHRHQWVTKGPYIECTRGQHPHGIPYDHINEQLVGTDKSGAPIFAPIVLSTKVPKIEATSDDRALTRSDNKKD